MNRNFAFFASSVAVLALASCLGFRSRSKEVRENTAEQCNDGLDNDGDNNFDCYDSDCRELDSTMRLDGDTLCHYENYGGIRVSSSSAILSSSSMAPSSSSATDSLVEGFPFAVQRYASDSVQILSLYRKPGTNQIALSGRLRSYGLFGVIDTTGNSIIEPDIVRTPSNLTSILGFGAWTETGRLVMGLDTSITGGFMSYGSSQYSQGYFATSYLLSSDLSKASTQAWPDQASRYAYLGVVSPGALCIAVNQADTGYALVDEDASDNSITGYRPVSFLNGVLTAGEIVNEQCALIGTRTTANPDSSQIWFFLLDKTNEINKTVQVTTGSSVEKSIDLEIMGGKTYVAATVNGASRVLVLGTSHNLENNGSNQSLNGTLLRIRRITVAGESKLLIMGNTGNKAALWLMNADGSVNASTTFTEASAFSDAIQLGNGHLLVAGWKSNSSGTGTAGVIFKINTALALVN